MDRAKLEHLLIDRRLGELAPEVGELLDAYLVANPCDVDAALEVNAAIEQARLAIARDARSPSGDLPPFPAARVSDALRAPNRSKVLRRLRPIAAAAAIVLAFILGTRTATTPTDSTPQPIRLAIADTADDDTVTSSFWSVDRYVSARPDRQTLTKKTLEWTSPLAWPRIGELQ